jgi:hypothetical protein
MSSSPPRAPQQDISQDATQDDLRVPIALFPLSPPPPFNVPFPSLILLRVTSRALGQRQGRYHAAPVRYALSSWSLFRRLHTLYSISITGTPKGALPYKT